jgi:hypothetical protein
MERSHVKSICNLVAIFVLGFLITKAAPAQNAVAAFNGYNSAYLVQNGQTFYASTMGTTTPEGEWQQALDIYPALDAYRYNRTQTNYNLVTALLNSLTYYNSTETGRLTAGTTTWRGWSMLTCRVIC